MEESRLGLKEYWEESYGLELHNLEDFGDEGEIWFGEDVMESMLEFTEAVVHSRSQAGVLTSDPLLVDLGTGNGIFLHKLADLGFTKLMGTDYSPKSIELCKKLADQRGYNNIRFKVDDLLASMIGERFDVACDKGTFDAVGLAPDGHLKRLLYPPAVANLLKPQGLLVITSCNCTLDELVKEFELSSKFKYIDHFKSYPSFSFGGMVGTTVCTVAFQRLCD